MKNSSVLYAEKMMNIIISAVSVLESLGEEFMNENNDKQEWNYKQILGHLIDSAYQNHKRVVLTLTEGHMFYSSYDQDIWVDINQYKLRSSEEIIQTFISVQQHFAILVSGIPESDLLAKHSKHRLHEMSMSGFDKDGEGSLSFLIWDYIIHLEHHLSQIIKGYITVNFKDYYK